MPHKPCLIINHKTLLFNKILDHSISVCHVVNYNVKHTSIYKSVLGLNETGGTLFLIPYVQYRREVLAYPVNLQVCLDDHHLLPCLGMPPNQHISDHPNDVKISDIQPPSSSLTFNHRISYSEWDKPGLSE